MSSPIYQTGNLTTPAVRTVAPFVGRKHQLEILEQRLQEAIAGHPQIVLLQGDAGAGKTRLVKELRPLAERHGIQVCYGRCYEDVALPYLPFVESLLTQLAQQSENVAETLGADAEVIRGFQQQLAVTVPTTNTTYVADPEQNTLRLFLALTRATIALAQSRPTVLILDDLHWADRSSLDLFSHLVFAVADASMQTSIPLLIIGVHRPVEPEDRLARTLARFQREPICQTLELHGFEGSEIDDFLQGLGLTQPARQLIAMIDEATRGNPLFIQEAVHHLLQAGSLHERAGYVVSTVSPTELRLPKQITTAMAARLSTLSAECHKLLTLASLLGERFSFPLLLSVAQETGTEEQLLDLLEEGVTQRLLQNEGQEFHFTHPLIRHVFSTAPSVPRRQRLHLQIAKALEHSYQDGASEHLLKIAHHLVNAGPVAEAKEVIEYTRRAGDHASAMFAWGEAAHYYEAALSTGETAKYFFMHEQAELHHYAGLARYHDMDIGPCLDHYEQAITAYRSIDNYRGLAEVLMAKVVVYFTHSSVSYGTLIDDVRPLEALLPTLEDEAPVLCGEVCTILAQAYWHARQATQAEETARKALQIGRVVNDDRICAYASHGLALAQTLSFQVREAVVSWQNAREFTARANTPWFSVAPLSRHALALTWLGRLDEAEQKAVEACAAARKVHNWGEYSMGLATRTAVAVAQGRFASASQLTQETLQMVRRSHYPWGGASVVSTLAGAYALQGNWQGAEDTISMLVEPGRIFAEPGPAVQFIAWIYQQLLHAYSHSVCGDMGPVATNLIAMGGTDVQALAGFCALIEIADISSDPALAASLHPPLARAFDEGIVLSSGWQFLIPRVLGVCATLNSWWDTAEHYFTAAIDIATKTDAQPELGRSYLDYARMLARRAAESDRDKVRALVTQAQAIFTELGMTPFIERAKALADSPRSSFEPQQSLQQSVFPEVLVPQSEVYDGEDRPLRATGGAPIAVATETSEVNLIPCDQPLPSQSSSQIILFSNVADSATLTERLGAEKAVEILHVHSIFARMALRTYNGKELQHTGDGCMASFVSAESAIDCAIAMHKAFTKFRQEHPETDVQVGIVIATSVPLSAAQNLPEAAGNMITSVCSLAHGGEILVAEEVHQLVKEKGIVFVDRGICRVWGSADSLQWYEIQC